jgi:hypothetical protein
MKTEIPMDFHSCHDNCFTHRPRSPIAVWLMVAFIGAVLGAATVAAALSTDTRDFASRHGTVLRTQAL